MFSRVRTLELILNQMNPDSVFWDVTLCTPLHVYESIFSSFRIKAFNAEHAFVPNPNSNLPHLGSS